MTSKTGKSIARLQDIRLIYKKSTAFLYSTEQVEFEIKNTTQLAFPQNEIITYLTKYV